MSIQSSFGLEMKENEKVLCHLCTFLFVNKHFLMNQSFLGYCFMTLCPSCHPRMWLILLIFNMIMCVLTYNIYYIVYCWLVVYKECEANDWVSQWVLEWSYHGRKVCFLVTQLLLWRDIETLTLPKASEEGCERCVKGLFFFQNPVYSKLVSISDCFSPKHYLFFIALLSWHRWMRLVWCFKLSLSVLQKTKVTSWDHFEIQYGLNDFLLKKWSWFSSCMTGGHIIYWFGKTETVRWCVGVCVCACLSKHCV